MTAEDATKLLLSFYFDLRPGPRIGKLTDDRGGEGPSHDVTCPDCEGAGWQRTRKFGPGVMRNDAGHLFAPCARCKRRGWLTVDDYTGREMGTEETGLVSGLRRTVTCDSCGGAGAHGNGRRCHYCHGSGSVALPDVREPRQTSKLTKRDRDEDAQRESLRAARGTGQARLWASGSFDALERAIAELTPPMRWRLIQAYCRTNGTSDEPDLLHIVAARVRKMEGGKVRVPAELRRWAEGQKPQEVERAERRARVEATREWLKTWKSPGLS